MSKIKQIQEYFYEGVLNNDNISIVDDLCINKITPEFRMNIHRNNILENLRYALELTFPAIWKLVGQECADNLAYIFVKDKRNLPVSHCLDDWGGKFPKFLKQVKQLSHLFYLEDIAQVEWLKHLSYCGKDYQPLDPIIFQKISAKHLEKLRLQFNPTLFLHCSSYFLKDIFDLVEHPGEKDIIDLKCVPCYAIINRDHKNVVIYWISGEMFDFIKCIKKGFTLIQSYEYLIKTTPDFDLVATLQFMLKNNLLWKCL